MIYDQVDSSQPIQQGDIFEQMPRVDLDLASFLVVRGEQDTYTGSWREVIREQQNSETALVGVTPVTAIVVTQNCDCLRNAEITLCEIRRFELVHRQTPPATPRKWASVVTTQSKLNVKWFYLPIEPAVGIANKMAVDFEVTLRVKRTDLEALKELRIGRLNDIALQHFRERISYYLRRFPFDEWYPLDREEFEAYCIEHPDSQPFPWQEPVVNS